MAIYRAEQHIFTFAGEAGHGGYVESVTGSDKGGGGAGTLNGDHPAGSRSILMATPALYAVGDYIQIEAPSNVVAEIRKITAISDSTTFTLDYPTSYYHRTGVALNEVESAFSSVQNYITFIPGAWESIDAPDMTPEILPQYFLGSASNRNFYIAYRGKQTFGGAVPNMIMLNGTALRFPIGSVATTGADVGGGGGSTLDEEAFKGDLVLGVAQGNLYDNNDYIQIDTGALAEVRQIISGAGANGANETFVLDYPLMMGHDSGTTLNEVTSPYTHTISEKTVLDTVTWNLIQRDSDETAANDFTRRFVGGLVNRMVISSEEGGMLRVSWDDVQFLDLLHNQKFHTGIGSGTEEIIRYQGAITIPTPSVPTTQPYYFSNGEIKLFDQTFGRIRNFRLEVNNNAEPRHYIRKDGHDRAPTEIHEQRREYRLSASIGLPDSAAAATSTTATLFKELLLEGNYASLSGFDISIVFTSGPTDSITFTIPPSSASAGGDAQGAFITSAPTPVGAESPLQVDVEILFRSMEVVVVDSVGTYP